MNDHLDLPGEAENQGNGNGQPTPSANGAGDININIPSPIVDGGITIHPVQIEFVQPGDGGSALTPISPTPIMSPLSSEPAINAAELVEISGSDGKFLYYPKEVKVQLGDVFYLRERNQDANGVNIENGLIVQVIKTESASYAQVDSKIIWRLLTSVRAKELQRSHHEPTEVIDLFLTAIFKVRAEFVDGKWRTAAGNIVTRNVDIFAINPTLLLANILTDLPLVNVHLGDFKGHPVRFSGQGFDKINLITGMKGSGKSHITKGIIDTSRQRGMSAVVFDINNEYGSLPNATMFRPGVNFKFRLDRLSPYSFLEIIKMLAPFAERTAFPATAMMGKLFAERKAAKKPLDIAFLKEQATAVFPNGATYVDNMRSSYIQSLETLETFNLFQDGNEIVAEDKLMGKKQPVDSPTTLSSTFYNLDQNQQAGVVVFSIGGLAEAVQRAVVKLVRDGLVEICDRQYALAQKTPGYVPIYPTVYFEEAHMYMDERDINALIPVIRHLGMNLFFITNTPGNLPESVFRLLDNLIMTRIVNEGDIRRVEACGLVDDDTIEGFAPQLPEYHALMLSSKDGVTKTFPLVFQVRDFGLPKSGVTRSMWGALNGSAASGPDQSTL